jgi:hypothetical protein
MAAAWRGGMDDDVPEWSGRKMRGGIILWIGGDSWPSDYKPTVQISEVGRRERGIITFK